jgi:hypothetical protein
MTTTSATTPHRTEPQRSAAPVDVGAIFARGAVAGLVAGVTFILANMWYADAHGKPPVAPFLDISTIFHGSDAPVISADNVVAGLVTHTGLSMLFGIVFAVGVAVARLGARPLLLTAAGPIYGLLLYLVNFQILGRAFFGWFVDPNGPNQGFEVWIHAVGFGLVLVPFFLTTRITNRS